MASNDSPGGAHPVIGTAPRPAGSVSVIVPTFREVENIPHLISRLQAVRDRVGYDIELVFMDDDSADGSALLVSSLALPWVRMITRNSTRSLSAAVLDGFAQTQGDIIVVMDADLSHPPEKIPELIEAVKSGAELAVGSRFVDGGSTADEWGVFRWLNSRVATLLARPLTIIDDPMSGFFALRRKTLGAGKDFSPVGYKIMLEVLVKCDCRLVVEVPIHFETRHFGKSKLSLREQFKYLRHLRRLYIHRYGTWSHLAQFLVVGASGLGINLCMLTLLLHWRIPQRQAVAGAIVISMVWNFALNRRFSFSYARDQALISQFCGFVVASSVGAVVNYFTTIRFSSALGYPQLAAILGVIAGTAFNFVSSRFLVFRSKHVRT